MKQTLLRSTRVVLLASTIFLAPHVRAAEPSGAWRESPRYLDTKTNGEIVETTVRVWAAPENAGLRFSWSGGVNERHEAEGMGELVWSNEENETVSRYIGSLKGGQRSGLGTLWITGGETYRGQWLADQKSGHGICYYPNGDSYEGSFGEGLWHGEGVLAAADGTAWAGRFNKGQRPAPDLLTLVQKKVGSPEPGMAPRQVQVAIDQDYTKKLTVANEGIGGEAISYRSRVVDGTTTIEPNLPVLDEWRAKGHAVGPQDSDTFGVGPVPLVVTISNPGRTPLVIESGALKVARSAPDLQPLIVFWGKDVDTLGAIAGEGILMSTAFTNLAEGEATNCVLEFNITPLDEKAPSQYAFKKEIGTISDKLQVDLSAECAQLGVNPTAIRGAKTGDSDSISPKRARAMLGKFARFDKAGKWVQSNGRLNARLSYQWTDSDGKVHKEQTVVQGLVVMDPRTGLEYGAGGPELGDYHLLLEDKKSDYSLPFAFRNRIAPGGNARLRLHIAAPRTSDHRLEVVLKTSDGTELKSAPVQMHFFLPRGEQDFIKTKKVRLTSQ